MDGTEGIDNGSVRAEIAALLERDETRLGDVYKLTRENKSPAEIAEALGVATSGFVSNYRAILSALLDGEMPSSTTIAGQIASRVRTWLKRTELSAEAQQYLDDLQSRLQLRSEDSVARSIEDENARNQTDVVERQNIPGIYVYTLPHYLRYPFDVDSGRTLLKVGRSERDTFARVSGQTRITALPEDPILLRVYQVDPGQSAEVEKDFHGWLDDANHDRSRSLRGGTEWFLTSTRFLDRIARTRSLTQIVVNDYEAGDL
ncbi:GIY-YIG nuclease family protein [Rhodococcus kyotonensis]|uniref:GIY-YIG nuclease family protein n=1 Tax=Nocardiaceae TaxID=85025 RepID=UPI0008384813|nr:GIY-YIG nuclease family protein [Rhodococcus kyotonensis]